MGVYSIDEADGHNAGVSSVTPMARGQSEVLVPTIQDIIKKSGHAFADIDLIATTVGPGAFTGLRIGLSTARSFGLALDIPVAGVKTTEAIATQYINQNKTLDGNLLVTFETKREDFYVQAFSNDTSALGAVSAISLEVLLKDYAGQKMTVIGDGLPRCREMTGSDWPSQWVGVEGFDLIDPGVIAAIAAARHVAGTGLPPDPLYLRGADVSQSTKVQRVIAGSK